MKWDIDYNRTTRNFYIKLKYYFKLWGLKILVIKSIVDSDTPNQGFPTTAYCHIFFPSYVEELKYLHHCNVCNVLQASKSVVAKTLAKKICNGPSIKCSRFMPCISCYYGLDPISEIIQGHYCLDGKNSVSGLIASVRIYTSIHLISLLYPCI